ncbi:hypothetical protein D3C86_1072480 [compost metagenome]
MQNAMSHSKYVPRANEVWLRTDIQDNIPPAFAEHFYLQLTIDSLIALAIQRAQSCSYVVAQVGYKDTAHCFEVRFCSQGSAEEEVEFFLETTELLQSVDASGAINWEAFDLVNARSRVSCRRGDFGAAAFSDNSVRIWFTWPGPGNRHTPA